VVAGVAVVVTAVVVTGAGLDLFAFLSGFTSLDGDSGAFAAGAFFEGIVVSCFNASFEVSFLSAFTSLGDDSEDSAADDFFENMVVSCFNASFAASLAVAALVLKF